MTAKAYFRHYAAGAGASALNGGVTALTAFFGTAGASAAGLPVNAMTAHQALATFAGAAVLAALGYFKANPLPVETPTDTPAPAAK
jgi:ABC-type nitrate/sulfonate/bicarbonate transport system substrate-binding protein